MAADRHFTRHDIQPRVRLEFGSNQALKEAVAAGLGIGIVSRHALDAGLSQSKLRVLPVQGFPIDSRWHIVHRRSKELSPIAKTFRNSLRAAAVL